MKIGKHQTARVLFALEIIVFAGFYLFGSNGIVALRGLKKEIGEFEKELVCLKKDVDHLQSTVVLQKKHPFFQEKIAREQLQMARADEEIYLI